MKASFRAADMVMLDKQQKAMGRALLGLTCIDRYVGHTGKHRVKRAWYRLSSIEIAKH